MKVRSYKDLEAYKKSYDLVKQIYKATEKFPKEEVYGIVSQLRRASVSVPANISEGFVRGSKEYIQFLKIGLGSAAELETLLSLSRDLKFCSVEDFEKVYGINIEVIKLLRHYIKKLAAANR